MYGGLIIVVFVFFPIIGFVAAFALSNSKRWDVLRIITYFSLIFLLIVAMFYFTSYSFNGIFLDYISAGLGLSCVTFLITRLYFPKDKEDKAFYLTFGIILSIIIIALAGPLFTAGAFLASDDERTISIPLENGYNVEKQPYGNAFSSSGLNIKIKKVIPFFPLIERTIVNEPFRGDDDRVNDVKVEFDGERIKVFFGEDLQLDTLVN